MFVRNRLSSPAVTIHPEASHQDAMRLMQEHKFRRLPVVDKKGKLVGIVSERDLLYAAPSSATSLNVWEINYLLAKLQVKEIMTKEVVSTTLDTPVEDAAHLMAVNKIGGLPVVDEEHRVVGLITETDIFKVFDEMFCGGYPGTRLTIRVPEEKGTLLKLFQAIYELDGDVESVGVFLGEVSGERRLVIKVRDVQKEQLVANLEALGEHIVDARDV